MKKFLCMILSLIAIIALTGCNSNEHIEDTSKKVSRENQTPNLDSNEEKNPIVEVSGENKELIKEYFNPNEMNIYDMFQIIRLDENPTTGYTWQYKVADDTIAIVEADEYIQDNTDEGVVGVGGIHTFRLCGLAKGETTITFRYMRSWEGEASAIEKVVFMVRVDEEGKIAITSQINE